MNITKRDKRRETASRRCFALVASSLVAGVVSTGGLSAFAQDGTWKYREGVGTSVASMTAWDDPANWVDGIVATNVDSLALFPNASPTYLSGKSLWISIPDQYMLGSVKYQGVSHDIHLVGKTIRMKDSASKTDHGWKSARFYGTSDAYSLYVWADVILVDGDFSPYHVYVNAPFSASGKLTCSSVSRLNRGSFATSADKVVANLFEAAEWSPMQQIFIDVPAASPANSSFYALTAGKPLVKRVSGSASPAPGSLITSDGLFPAGTFVKRRYSDTWLEMSAPALVASDDAEIGTEVAFGAFALSYSQDVPSLNSLDSNGNGGIVLEPPAGTTLTADIAKVSGTNPLLFYSNADSAGNYILHDIAALQTAVARHNVTLTFAGEEGPSSDVLGTLKFKAGAGRNKYGSVNLSVPKGRVVTVNALAADAPAIALSTGQLHKYGAGDLIVRSDKAVNPAMTVSAGTLVFDASSATSPTVAGVTVNGGTFASAGGVSLGNVTVKKGGAYRVSADDGATWSSLTFAAGAMLEIPEGVTADPTRFSFPDGIGFRLGKNVTFNPGAVNLTADSVIELEEGAVLTLDETVGTTAGTTVRGPGTVVLGSNAQAKNFILEDGAVLRTQAAAGMTLAAEPVAAVVGHPAFWVDASVFTNAAVETECVESGCVKRWNDVRPGETMYAYKDGTRPTLVKNAARGMPKVKFDRVTGTPTDATLGTYRCMLWNRELSGIRAVFLVEASFDSGHGGGIVLGATPGAGYNDFKRESIGTWSKPLVVSAAAACVRNGASYVYGHRGVPTTQAFNGYEGVQLVELHPLAPGGRANAFAISGGDQNGSGCMNICECIVYTNELTYAERARVAQYLHKKWISPSTSVYYDAVSPDATLSVQVSATGGGLDVPAGSTMAVDSLMGEGTFIKRGAGELRLTDMTNTAANLSLEAGVTTIRSYEPTADDLPADAFIRLDSTATETLRLDNSAATMPVGTEKTRVNIWRDANGGSIRARRRASGYPNWYLVNEGPNGETVVDFGRCISTNNSWKVPESGRYMMQFGTSETVGSTASSLVVANNARSVFMVWGSKYGGNQFTGNYNNTAAPGMSRDAANSAGAEELLTYPIIKGTYDATLGVKTEWRKNGAVVDPRSTLLSGSWDVVSYHSPFTGGNFSFDALAFDGCGRLEGGMQIGEFIAYTNVISQTAYRQVDAYLNRKWFGRYLVGYRPAALGTLRVDAGATLTVDGNAPVKVGTLVVAGGTVNGAVVLAENAVIEVPVEADGAITQTLTAGSVDVSKCKTVLLTDNVKGLKAGAYQLIASAQIGSVDGWTVTGYEGRKILQLKSRADGLWLEVKDCGLMLLVK